MSGAGLTIVVLALLTIGLLVVSAWRAVFLWRRLREPRLVTCPETGHTEAVTIDAPHAAVDAFLDGHPEARLAHCSRWATRGRCEEACLPQLEEDGEERAISRVAGRFFAGRPCTICGRPIADAEILDHHAALADAAGVTVEWTEVPPERLPDALATRAPVCWNCHLTESFRRLHPDLVVDRPLPPSRTTG